jgi:probable F420-dependent oxidoreductase
MRAEWAERLGGVGVWSFDLDALPVRDATAFARRVEELGFGSLWLAEGVGSREAFVHSALLLGATERLAIGTGIASVWARDAVSARSAARALADAYPRRFVLGLGISHAGAVARRGHEYAARPLAAMREYLDAMDAAAKELKSPLLDEEPPRVIAALRSKMLALAGAHADGAHTYFVPVQHTARARAALGPDALLITEQAVIVDTDPDTARAAARSYCEHYLARDNYRNNLLSLGYRDDELSGGGADRVVDDLVAWGTVTDLVERVEAQLAAGADHVVVQVVSGDVDATLSAIAAVSSGIGRNR